VEDMRALFGSITPQYEQRLCSLDLQAMVAYLRPVIIHQAAFKNALSPTVEVGRVGSDTRAPTDTPGWRQGKTLRVEQALGRHLTVAVKDALEVLVEVLDGQRAQLVEDPAHFDPIVGVR